MTAKRRRPRGVRYRSARTGRYVTKAYAKRHKATTVAETL